MTNSTDNTPQIPPPTLNPIELPITQAALGLQHCIPAALGAVPLDDLVIELQAALLDPDSADLDNLLATQARMLDALFSRSMTSGLTPKGYDEERVALALKAQAQCRNTVTAIRQMQQARIRDNVKKIKKSANEMMERR